MTAPATYYLACPYTSDNPALSWSRMALASRAAAHFMSHEDVVFSPITHGHAVAKHLPYDLVTSHEFWMRQCLPLVEWAGVFLLLPLHGWRESRGVQRELTYAKTLGKRLLVVQLVGIPSCELFDTEQSLADAGLPGAVLELIF